MKKAPKNWRLIFIAATVVAAFVIAASLAVFTARNRARITVENREYLTDNAAQMAQSIDSALTEGYSNIKMLSRMVSDSLTGPEFDVANIQNYIRDSVFDFIEFADTDGMDHNITGGVSDARDRKYYLDAKEGRSGMELIYVSRATHETLLMFYAPITYEGEFAGSLVGVYQAANRITRLLASQYFGSTATAYLADESGRIIASNQGFDPQNELYVADILGGGPEAEAVLDPAPAPSVPQVFRLPGNETGGCVVRLRDNGGYLIQIFPPEASESMIRSANAIGYQLVTILVLMCFAVLAALIMFYRHQQQQLQDALDSTNDANLRNEMLYEISDAIKWSYEIGADGQITAYSYAEKGEEIVRSDGFAGDPMAWADQVHPDDREAALEAFQAAIHDRSAETPYDSTYRIMGTDGEYVWLKVAGRMTRRKDGTGEMFGVSMDITDQMEEQQKRLLGNMPLSNDVLAKANLGMWAFELDEGQPPRMYDDETMLGLVGLDHQVPPEEAYHAWYDHIDEGSYDLVNDAVAKMMDGEHAEVQYPWHYPDGRTIIVRCGGVRNYQYTKGIRIEGTHQNVTETLHFDEEERKREQQQKEDEIARIRAEAADKAKTEFLFNMSHDIRTPMNAILGYTDIALNHIEEKERVSDSLKKIKTSGGHLLNLINDILEMSRIEAGRLEIVSIPTNIYEVSEGIIHMSQALAATKDITFRAEIGDLKNPYIYSDELHTNQIIINLISNAIKYTNPGGTVEYRVEQIGGPADGIADYRITVKDNGIGMSEEFQTHLFESFAREQTATVSKQEGAGLGLAIVKRIVDLSGGSIRAQSRQGEGTAFTVELPQKVMDAAAIEAFEASRHAGPEASADSVLEGKKVLLVEDNEMNREIATEILEESGLLVESAEDGAIAVRKVMERGADHYDFILMDIQMPVMNGYEATAEIRKLPGGDRIPIIALSANAFKEDRDKSLAAGMNDHVAKPIDIRDLFRTLEKFTD